MSITKQHSSYWLDDDLFDDIVDDKPKTDLQRITRLSAVRRGIANFVSILSGENVPVHFSSGNDSYTDGKKIIISADEDVAKFDVMVGLALHEGSHVLLSDFTLLQALHKSVEKPLTSYSQHLLWITEARVTQVASGNVFKDILHPTIANLLPEFPTHTVTGYLDPSAPYWNTSLKVLNDLRFIMNILEDRRIDNYVYNNAVGYRPYYKALYNKYFYTKEMGKNLRFNPKFRELTTENYITRLLYCIHPAANWDAMPGLRSLINLMDLNTIERVSPKYDKQIVHDVFEGAGLKDRTTPRPAWLTEPNYESMPVLWQEANVLYAYILKYVGMVEYDESSEKPAENSMDSIAQKNSSALNDLPNLDGAPGMGDMEPVPVEKDVKGSGKNATEVDGKFNEKTAEKELDAAKKVMAGDVKKKKLSKSDAAAVTAFEEADAKLVDITGEGVPFGKCMVTRKLTDQLIEQDWFIFKRYGWNRGDSNQYIEKSIATGKRMGQILVQRLQVRNDPLITKQTRLSQGGLDRRLLAQLGMDITSVFQKSRTDIHKPAMLHLTLDASGSMTGNKWNKVRSVAIALAYVGSKLRNVDTVISLRGGNDIPIVSVVYDSRRDQFTKFIQHMRVLDPSGATPEGLCFKATMDLILECKNSHDVYFINFSDGEPSFGYNSDTALGKGNRRSSSGKYFSYTGETATKHTRAMIQQLKDANIKVLSYFISENNTLNKNGYNTAMANFQKMYGEDATMVNVENASEVLRTLNSRLLVRG
jgi:hypothetical protein